MAWYPIKGGENVTPEVTAQTGLIDSIKTQLVGKATGANATADKILEGFSAWVNGQLVQGTAKDPSQFADLKSAGGFTKMAVDKFSLTTDTIAQNIPITHSLGDIPLFILLLGPVYTGNYYIKSIYCIFNDAIGSMKPSLFVYSDSNFYKYNTNATRGADSVTLGEAGYNFKYAAGIEYTLITMA